MDFDAHKILLQFELMALKDIFMEIRLVHQDSLKDRLTQIFLYGSKLIN